jgi:hypothetical protein
MAALNWLLLHAGNAALWLWHALGWLLAQVGTGLDALLNPVLSPVLAVLNRATTAAGDGVYAGVGWLPAWAGLTLLSALAGVLLMIAFRYTSNQRGIGAARDAISANLLSLKLYKGELGVALRAQGRLLGALARLQWHTLRPMLILALPLMLVAAQMGLRYQWRPLRPGEEALVRVTLNSAAAEHGGTAARLAPNLGVADAVGPVPGGGALVWRIRAGAPGRHTLIFTINGVPLEKELVVGTPYERVSETRPGRDWTAQLLHPAEKPLRASDPAQRIVVEYPGVDSRIYGADWWILTFFVVSMIAALAAKPFLHVRI